MLSSLRHKCQKANQLRRMFGIQAVAQHVINEVGQRVADFEGTVIVWLDRQDLSTPLELPADTEMRFLTPDEVAIFAQDAASQIRNDLVSRAFAGTDHCFAALIDGRLASYGWYSVASEVPADDFGLLMSVPAGAAYMHNGFTHPDFRGRRLHGIGMGRALHALSDRGINALFSDVDWANHASLRSCWRSGYRHLGTLFTFGRGRLRCAIRPRLAETMNVTFRRIRTDEPSGIALSEMPAQ